LDSRNRHGNLLLVTGEHCDNSAVFSKM